MYKSIVSLSGQENESPKYSVLPSITQQPLCSPRRWDLSHNISLSCKTAHNMHFTPVIPFAPDYHLSGASQVALVVKNPSAIAGDIRDVSLIPGLGRSSGGGHGNPLQYSCLENPTDRRAWWATVHRFTKKQTPLKRLSMHAHTTLVRKYYSHFTDKEMVQSGNSVQVMELKLQVVRSFCLEGEYPKWVVQLLLDTS